jgi:hypothetical protein
MSFGHGMLGARIGQVAREFARYKLDLVGVREARWDKRRCSKSRELCFLYGEGNEYHQLGTGISVHHRIVLTVKKQNLLVTGCYI